MKDNKLYHAMNYLEDELVNEALQPPVHRRFPLVKLTAAAAVLAVAALSAAVLVNLRQQPERIIGQTSVPEAPAAQTSSSATPSNTEPSQTPAPPDTEPSPTELPVTDTPSTEPTDPSANTSSPTDENESHSDSDILGFIIKDGKTYMPVFPSVQYTPDRAVGYARDFKGTYSDMEDDSMVYTVKEDNEVLLLSFANGGSVTLLLWEPEPDGYFRFNGLRVDAGLKAALSSMDGGDYEVYVTRPDSESMYRFTYNGRTIGDIKAEMTSTQKQLATLLWITGEANGEGLVTAWGEDFLTEAEAVKAQYLDAASGTYDLSKAAEDAQACHRQYDALYTEYQQALDASLRADLQVIYDTLLANGISATLTDGVHCTARMSRDQFISLAATGTYPDYAFGLLSGSYLIMDDPEA